MDKNHHAQKLINLEVERSLTIELLKASEFPIPIDGGYVGWNTWPDNKVKKDDEVLDEVVSQWFRTDDILEVGWYEIRGFVKALGLGVGNINSLAKVIFGKKEDAMKQDFLDKCLEKMQTRRFGIWKNKDD